MMKHVKAARRTLTAGFGNLAVEETRRRVGASALDATLLAMQRATTSEVQTNPYALLTEEELNKVWIRCSEIRAATGAVIRTVATHMSYVEPAVPADDPDYDTAKLLAELVADFLASPNDDGDTWLSLQMKSVRDLLVMDRYAVERAYDGQGQLVELIARPGGRIVEVRDTKDRLLAYNQVTPGKDAIVYRLDQLMYANMSPSTYWTGGTPLIESLVQEVAALLNAVGHLVSAWSVDEIPPGLLVVAGLADAASKRLRESFKESAGQDHKLRIVSSQSGDVKANWVELRRGTKDLDLASLTHAYRRTVWRVFGVKPITMGDSEATPKATAEVQLTAEGSGLIRPILDLIAAKTNADVIPALLGQYARLVRFCYDLERDDTATEAKQRVEGEGVLFNHAVYTLNEWRIARGETPIKNGDVRLMKTSNGWVRYDDVVSGKVNPDGTVSDSGSGSDSAADEPAAARWMFLVSGPLTKSRPMSRSRAEVVERIRSIRRGAHKRRGHPHGHGITRASGDGDKSLPESVGIAAEAFRQSGSDAMRRIEQRIVSSILAQAKNGELESGAADKVRSDAKSAVEETLGFFLLRELATVKDAVKDSTEQAAAWSATTFDYTATLAAGMALHQRITTEMSQNLASSLVDDLNSVIVAGSARDIMFGVSRATVLASNKLPHYAGMVRSGAAEAAVDQLRKDTERTWYATWHGSGGKSTCSTCSSETSIGKRPVTELGVYPGSGTECGGNCRCTLTFSYE